MVGVAVVAAAVVAVAADVVARVVGVVDSRCGACGQEWPEIQLLCHDGQVVAVVVLAVVMLDVDGGGVVMVIRKIKVASWFGPCAVERAFKMVYKCVTIFPMRSLDLNSQLYLGTVIIYC